MIQLVRNEWFRLRKERSLWFALLLHLAPLAMVVIASVMKAITPGPNLFFILYNQSMIVTGLVACVVTSIVFHIEFSNRTWFDWLMQPQGPVLLVFAKIITAALLLCGFVIISTVLMVIFLVTSDIRNDVLTMTISYLVFQLGTLSVMLAFSSAVCTLSRSTVVVNVIGVAVSMITIVVMTAEFAWAIPTAWAYRTGLVILDPEYAFAGGNQLALGGIINATFIALCLFVAVAWSRRPAVINATMR